MFLSMCSCEYSDPVLSISTSSPSSSLSLQLIRVVRQGADSWTDFIWGNVWYRGVRAYRGNIRRRVGEEPLGTIKKTRGLSISTSSPSSSLSHSLILKSSRFFNCSKRLFSHSPSNISSVGTGPLSQVSVTYAVHDRGHHRETKNGKKQGTLDMFFRWIIIIVS
jgi:hypothetical protein